MAIATSCLDRHRARQRWPQPVQRGADRIADRAAARSHHPVEHSAAPGDRPCRPGADAQAGSEPFLPVAAAGRGRFRRLAARGRRGCAGRLRRVECAGPLWLSAGQPRRHRRCLPPPLPWPRRPAEDAGC
ncbi:hypothetical protein G6F68_017457 [Rhizopus microsporus]|nr:hypothetical protein G6F68_017457 [Rhizopus microsporus]